jgi:hypothetical protein
MKRTSVFGSTVALLVIAAIVAVCSFLSNFSKVVNMTVQNPRLQPLFERTKTVCFGRFVIELPADAQVIWGDTIVPLGIWVEKGAANELASRVAEVEALLRSQPRYPLTKGLSLYFETIDGVVAGMRHVISQENFDGDGLLRINSLFAMGNDLVGMEARPLEEKKHRALEMLNSMARRLRPRSETELPSEAGACIENAFLTDAPDTKPEDVNEHIQVGFRLAEFHDVHLSIHIAPSSEMRWSLDKQLETTENRARKVGESEPFERLKIFRRAKREIHEWKTGFEILTRTPGEEGVHAYHDFWMKFTGAANDPLRPFADIQFQTGVGENSAGAVKPSLTDEEAIALWDKLTSSIRVRPTNGAKTSQAQLPKVSLGTLHVTGHRCPQTGWWECHDELSLAQPSGIWLEQGQLMPKARIWAHPNWWDRLKGERPVGWTAAVWRLAGYDKPPQKG